MRYYATIFAAVTVLAVAMARSQSVTTGAASTSKAENIRVGTSLLADHHDPEAMDRFESVLEVDPADPAARHGELAAATELALSAHQAGHPEVALQVLEHARTKLPDDPQLLFELGSEALEVHALPEASEALTLAHTLLPNDLDILYMLARVEIEQQHMPAAETHIRTYLTAKPNDATAHFGLGHILAMEQRADDARAEFQRSIALQPVQTESYYQIGQLELDAHHDVQAQPLFRKTLERDPNHGGALTGMGILAYRARDYAQADHYLALAVKAAPDYAPAHYYRGLTLARQGKKDEGDRELQKATELGHAASLVPGAAPGLSPAPDTP
jgi:tetratricopeptide (TPR) repeat protein